MNRPGHPEILGAYAANPQQDGEGGFHIGTGWCPHCSTVTAPKEIGHQCRCGADAVALRQWGVAALEDRIKAQFTDEVRKRHRAVYLQMVRTDPNEADEMRSKYMTDFAAGQYNWDDDENGTNHVRSARMKPWGYLYLMFLCLRRCDKTMTSARTIDICSANPEDAMAAYLWILGIPNPQASATKGTSVEAQEKGLDAESQQVLARAKEQAKASSNGASTAREETPTRPQPGTKTAEPTFS